MTTFNQLRSLVSDPLIGPDAWGDDVLGVAIQLVEEMQKSGELEECLQNVETLEGEAKVRLIQAITYVPSLDLFQSLLDLLPEANAEMAEVLVDGLRSWPLNNEQKQQLLIAAEPFRGRWSSLLDRIINNNKF